MASNDFETSNLGWQAQQLQQRAQEWIEFNLAIAFKKAADIGIGFPDWLYDALVWVAWIILSLASAWLGLLLFRLMRNYWLTSSHQMFNWGTVNPQPQIIPTYSVDRWLKEARKYQLEGNYAEACRALYLGMLQLLSDRQIIPQQYSLTDGEYRNLVANLTSSDRYQFLLLTHEQLCFSDRPISSEVFNNCQTAYETISQPVNDS